MELVWTGTCLHGYIDYVYILCAYCTALFIMLRVHLPSEGNNLKMLKNVLLQIIYSYKRFDLLCRFREYAYIFHMKLNKILANSCMKLYTAHQYVLLHNHKTLLCNHHIIYFTFQFSIVIYSTMLKQKCPMQYWFEHDMNKKHVHRTGDALTSQSCIYGDMNMQPHDKLHALREHEYQNASYRLFSFQNILLEATS